MRSALPKVLHTLAGKPLLSHVLKAANTVKDAQTIVVTGHGAELVESAVADNNTTFVKQTPAWVQPMPLHAHCPI